MDGIISGISSEFLLVMDRLTNEVRHESLWTMMFADTMVLCSESR